MAFEYFGANTHIADMLARGSRFIKDRIGDVGLWDRAPIERQRRLPEVAIIR